MRAEAVSEPLFAANAHRWTSAEMVELLRERYRSNSHALFEQVPPSTGFATNYADVIVMELWPSMGLHLHGFEIKVSRGDWLREIRNPAKADAVARYCDTWWVVAPTGIVGHSELRPGWGLLEPDGEAPGLVSGRRTALRARPAAIPKSPSPNLDRKFIAALIRRLHGLEGKRFRYSSPTPHPGSAKP